MRFKPPKKEERGDLVVILKKRRKHGIYAKLVRFLSRSTGKEHMVVLTVTFGLKMTTPKNKMLKLLTTLKEG